MIITISSYGVCNSCVKDFSECASKASLLMRLKSCDRGSGFFTIESCSHYLNKEGLNLEEEKQRSS